MGTRVTVSMTTNDGGDDFDARLVTGMNLALERGLALAVDLAPWDEGTLAGSGTVEQATDPEAGGGVVFDTPYAKRLHEHPEYDFQTDSNPNAQGKWAETAFIENRKELGDIMRKEARGG